MSMWIGKQDGGAVSHVAWSTTPNSYQNAIMQSEASSIVDFLRFSVVQVLNSSLRDS